MRRRTGLAIGAGTAIAIACGGADPEALRNVAAAGRAVATADAGRLMIAGLSEPGVGVVSAGCADAIHAGTTVDPEFRSSHWSTALAESCPRSCAADVFADLAAMDPVSRAHAAVTACDLAGPDPVFADAVRPLREEMDPLDFLVARTLFEGAAAATAGTSLEATYAGLFTTAAVGLALDAPPRVPAGGAGRLVRVSPNLDRAAAEATLAGTTGCANGSTVRLVVDPNGSVVGARSVEPGDCAAGLLTLSFPPPGTYGVVDAWLPPAPPGDAVLEIGTLDGLQGLIGTGVGGPALPKVEGDFGGPDAVVVPKVGFQAAAPTVDGSLGASDVTGVTRRHESGLRYCYERHLKVDPVAAGGVDVSVTIGADGDVDRVEARSSGLADEVVSCVKGRFLRMRFPPGSGSTTVELRYVFRPAGPP